MHKFFLLLTLLVTGCSKKDIFDFPLGISVENFHSLSQKSLDSWELTGVFHELIGYDQTSNFSGFDTLIRVGPVMFLDKPLLLNARVKNGLVYQYDMVLTRYNYMINLDRHLISKNAMQQHPDLKDGYWKNYINRTYSTQIEYNSINEKLITQYGKPDIIYGDTTRIWKSKGVSLLGRNNFSTTIVSYYTSDNGYDERNEWQECAVTQDTNLLIIHCGISAHELYSLLNIKDTNLFQFPFKACGVPGRITFTIDANRILSRYIWEAQSTGDPTMAGVYLNITREVGDIFMLNNVEKQETKEIEKGELNCSWSTATEITNINYQHTYRKLYVEKRLK